LLLPVPVHRNKAILAGGTEREEVLQYMIAG
jgi:hypothetical protein